MEFTYHNEPRKVIVMNHDETHVEGIDLSKLNSEEAAKITAIFKEMDEKLAPYLKSYRKFFKKEMIN